MADPNKPDSLRESADRIVVALAPIVSDVHNFPTDMQDARLKLALRGLDAALASQNDVSHLTHEQLAATVLIGRNLTFEEAARALGVPEGMVYLWDRTVPGFRREIAIWRETTEMDIEARLYSTITSLAADIDSLGIQDQTKLLTLMQKLAEKPEKRAQWAADHRLKREQLEVQKMLAEAARNPASTGGGGDNARVVEIMDNAADDIYEGIVEIEDGLSEL
ncbi:MAG: hypothetical protein ACYC63_04760 [Armatimonadota bacterium]